ncbi:hypothetical protein TFLX_04328 [Thermoflexales bacterium]|nr:hypothetical protein TFLX_04328 [Thermoflexales bacterium]
MLDVILILFGLFALIKGEFRITHNRKVRGGVSRGLGLLMLGSVGAAFLLAFYLPGLSFWIMLGALVLTIIIGLATAQKTKVRNRYSP